MSFVLVSVPLIRDAAFWLAAVCCLVANVAILRSVLHTVRSPRGDATLAVPAKRAATEIAWAVIPMAALVAVLVATWRAMHPSF